MSQQQIKLTSNSFHLIDKDIEGYLAPYLNHNEFKCRCDSKICNYTIINSKLLLSWRVLRELWDKPLAINSGFRCISHNASEAVGGMLKSRHTRGLAVDISTKKLNKDDREELIKLALEVFDTVLTYGTFIHCHINE